MLYDCNERFTHAQKALISKDEKMKDSIMKEMNLRVEYSGITNYQLPYPDCTSNHPHSSWVDTIAYTASEVEYVSSCGPYKLFKKALS